MSSAGRCGGVASWASGSRAAEDVVDAALESVTPAHPAALLVKGTAAIPGGIYGSGFTYTLPTATEPTAATATQAAPTINITEPEPPPAA